jgi:methyltransferase (TIGR00027 family)
VSNAESAPGGRLADSRPSLTARGIAHARTGFDRPTTATGDAEAGTLLAQSLGKPLPVQRGESFVSYVRGRTRFFDGQVTDALAFAPCQIAIIGAGYDDRALRFRTPGVRFVEVDHPVTQADKRRRLDRLGVDASDVVFVAADFEAGPVAEKLNQELDPDLPTTVLCEGVLPYLRRPSGKRLLRSLSRIAGAHAQLAADLPVIPRTWKGRLTFAGFRLYAAAVREPVRTALAPADVSAFLGEGGWREQRRITGSDLAMPASRSETVFIVAS